jgi:hypothetical protein
VSLQVLQHRLLLLLLLLLGRPRVALGVPQHVQILLLACLHHMQLLQQLALLLQPPALR